MSSSKEILAKSTDQKQPVLFSGDPVDQAMPFILGFMQTPGKKGLNGSVTRITDGINSAKNRLHLTDEQVARLQTIFNIK